MLSNLTITNFIDELASNSPAPGGGSVAALGASLSAALSSMVFSLTVGKKQYNNYDDSIKNLIDTKLKDANVIKSEFLNIMEEDTEVFLKVMDAFKLPKETEEEKAARSAKIEESYKLALNVPYKLAEKAYGLYDVLDVAVQYGNINAVSDAGVAALLLHASLESAVLNVKINLSSLKDAEEKGKISAWCKEIVSNSLQRKEAILKITNEKIEG